MKKLSVPTWQYLNENFDAPIFAKTDKYEVGTVLYTVNPQKYTNATIMEVLSDKYLLLTDIGNFIHLTEQELKSNYLSPECRRVKSEEDIVLDKIYP